MSISFLFTATIVSAICTGNVYPLKYIDYFISGEDCTAYKPNPEVYQKALAALDLSPDEAFAVEDSAPGIAAAKNAGMKVYALHNPNLDQSGATSVLKTLDELLSYL